MTKFEAAQQQLEQHQQQIAVKRQAFDALRTRRDHLAEQVRQLEQPGQERELVITRAELAEVERQYRQCDAELLFMDEQTQRLWNAVEYVRVADVNLAAEIEQTRARLAQARRALVDAQTTVTGYENIIKQLEARRAALGVSAEVKA